MAQEPLIGPYLRASYPILYVNTTECARAQEALIYEAIESSKKKNYQFFSWDCEMGIMQISVSKSGGMEKKSIKFGNSDQLSPITPLKLIADKNDPQILFLHNFHKWINVIDIQQWLLNHIDMMKSNGKAVVILSPVSAVPKEIEKFVVSIDFPLPSSDEISEIVDLQIRGLSSKQETVNTVKKDVENNWESILNASKGLCRFELENAIAMSLIDKKKVDPILIGGMKRQLVKRSETLEFVDFKETFADIGGLDNLKEFALKIVKSKIAKGILMTGVPGCGKTMIAKALGNEANLPVISLDFGRMFGKFVGESEGKMRDALQIIDRVSPCIVIVDEIEKGLGGVKSSHLSDGGTGARVFGSFLSWLQDKKGGSSYFFATSNDVFKLPPEFMRAGRWDGIFFVDLPNFSERKVILDIYVKKYSVDPSNCPDLKGYSGAEIESLCRTARILKDAGDEKCDLGAAGKFVIPLSRTKASDINEIREWARGNAIPASLHEAIEKTTNKSGRMLDTEVGF